MKTSKKEKIGMKKKIGGLDYNSFMKIMKKQDKIYKRNLEKGSSLKKINIADREKFAWSSTCDENDTKVIDEYHRNIKSFDLACDRVIKVHLKRMKKWWNIDPEELVIVGSPPPLEDRKYDWDEKEILKKDIQKILKKDGKFVFRMRYIGAIKEKRQCWQEWSSIYTMKKLNEEENELKEEFQKQAQEEANRTGKKAMVVNLVGWKFEAEPNLKK